LDEFVTLPTVALVGNPNVGKSTVFNALTGLKQHTGNWTGKTVDSAVGTVSYRGDRFRLVDLPGTYSLSPASPEEEVTRDFLYHASPDAVVVVADATCLERNLALVLQVQAVTNSVILCINLLDEAQKKSISIDLEGLSKTLGIPVVGTSARDGCGLCDLMREVKTVCSLPNAKPSTKTQTDPADFTRHAEEIYKTCVTQSPSRRANLDRTVDRLLTSKYTGIPLMVLFLGVILWLTVVGANYPSALLSHLFTALEPKFAALLTALHLPQIVVDALSAGMFRTTGWVVAVMLPPMAIFFPLFTLLEDVGYLPRIAFNLDHCFHCARAHGKQALTMCMGFGCNACGVVGCRIIDSPRERMIAILTNVFVPCNGRFPTLITLITVFFAGSNALFSSFLLILLIVFAVLITFLVSYFLSNTVLRGMPSSFVLELPPYRRPQIGKVLVRSLLDRTLIILWRAITVAAPFGLILWIFANVRVGDTSILLHLANFLDPFGHLIGLSGVILVGFLLGFPANEIVLPIILMCYLAGSGLSEYESMSSLHTILVQNGWTFSTALCTILFSLCHFPCATTCLTIWKETKSIRWTLLSILLPTLVGITLCLTVSTLFRLFT